MKNKSLAFTSIFFFAGAFLTFGLALFSRKISAPVLLVIDLLPEIALGAFLLFLSKSENKNFLSELQRLPDSYDYPALLYGRDIYAGHFCRCTPNARHRKQRILNHNSSCEHH